MFVSIKTDSKKLKRNLNRFQRKKFPKAQADAINGTLKLVKKGLQRQMQKDLDRPTPFTTGDRAFYMFKANDDQIHKKGTVGIKRIQENYLRPQVFGGKYVPKKGKIPVPTDSADLNRYGNLMGTRKTRLKRKGYFIKQIGNVDGVWQRRGDQLVLIAQFVDSLTYTKKPFKFFETGKRITQKFFPKKLRIQMGIAARKSMR